jgi:hypothetical protein
MLAPAAAGFASAPVAIMGNMRKPPQAKPQPPSAVVEMMRAEVDETPFGAAGSFSVPEPIEQPQPIEPFRIPPPDWAAEEAERRESERQELTAQLDKIKARLAELEAEPEKEAEE